MSVQRPPDGLPGIGSLEELRAASAAGLTLVAWRERQAAATPAEPERDPRVLEKDEQREVRKRFLAFGCHVYWLSQARESGQTPGLGDLWVVHRASRRAWWWETKRQVDGTHSGAQQEFRDECLECGVGYGTGDRFAAEQFLIDLGLAERGPLGTLDPITRAGRAQEP